MRRLGTIACMVAILGVATSSASAATLTVFELAFNINGTTYSSQAGQLDENFPVPGLQDPSGFLATGLGTLTLNFTPTVAATTTFSLLVFLDLEIDENTNTFFNEYGAVSGTPPAGVSWEIDEPGFGGILGDIYTNFTGNTLDNTNALTNPPVDDVAMALGWTFTLDPGQWASLTFGTSLTAPAGFSLAQIDPDSPVGAAGTTVYFTGDVDIKEQIPEPAMLLLLGTSLLFGARRFTRH